MANTKDKNQTDTDKGDFADTVLPETLEASRTTSTLDLVRLNRLLSKFAGTDFRLTVLMGEEVRQMDSGTLDALATCYAQLAKEKWYENWSVDSAREELEKYFKNDDDRIHLVSLVYKGDEIVGLCWAFIFSAKNPGNLAEHFSSAKLSNRENLEATRDWIAQVGGKETLISIRELGVLSQYRKIRAPLLCAPVYSRALEFKCKYIFLRTPVNSSSLKWSLGIGFVPVHYFVVNQMLLMLGNLEETVRDFEFRILDYFAGQLTAVLDQDRDFEAMRQQTELDYTEKMLVMQDLSANIAHEMRTPLSGVRATMDGLETILPKLLEAYRQSNEKSPETLSAIPEDRLRILENTPERITLMIDQANSVIDMLLMNLKDNKVDKKQFGVFSATACIKQALDRYPFKRGELEKITLDIEQDFYFRGIDHLFIFVLFNLIKNSIYSINAALKGEILITLKPGRGVNRIVFRDTGEGIEQTDLEKIFEGFYTTREEGTGVGLAFCRRTMRSFGGGITCDSESGEYAEFILEFPAI
jgi:signal transduction histidine kinase